MVNILIGVLLITVGATLLNISAITELIKANINERIVRHNVAINKLSEGETQSRAIGFATTYEEEDEHEL